MTENSVSFLKRGKFRKQIFCELQIPRTARELGKVLRKSRSQVHQTLQELTHRNLITSMHGMKGKGTTYKLTQKGENIFSELSELESSLPYLVLVGVLKQVRGHLIEGEYSSALNLINEHIKGQLDLCVLLGALLIFLILYLLKSLYLP